MPGRYELGLAGIAAAAGAAVATFHTGANVRARIREVGFFSGAATSDSILIGKPANTPVATTSVASTLALDGTVQAATMNVDTAWSTAPTAPAAANSGRGIIL